jgi:hypothetical protein
MLDGVAVLGRVTLVLKGQVDMAARVRSRAGFLQGRQYCGNGGVNLCFRHGSVSCVGGCSYAAPVNAAGAAWVVGRYMARAVSSGWIGIAP